MLFLLLFLPLLLLFCCRFGFVSAVVVAVVAVVVATVVVVAVVAVAIVSLAVILLLALFPAAVSLHADAVVFAGSLVAVVHTLMLLQLMLMLL